MRPLRPPLAPALGALALALAACQPGTFRPRPVDYDMSLPGGAASLAPAGASDAERDGPPPSVTDEVGEAAARIDEPPRLQGQLRLRQVVDSVTNRFPLYLAKLLERDLASGRLKEAMGDFDANLAGKLGGRPQGYYEATLAEVGLEQPLATGDTIYGGYRITDGFLPDYYSDRTQDDGRFFLGGRFPLLRDRSIDVRRRNVRVAQIDAALAEPEILAARIGYVQKASQAYFKWAAAGRKLQIARQLLELAELRQDGLSRAVERQFLAPIVLTDNTSLIAKRKIYVAQAERSFQAAALGLSLFLRDDGDEPIVATADNLPDELPPLPPLDRTVNEDVALAARQRPDLGALQLEIERVETDRDLAENQMLPNLDVVLDVATPLNSSPYSDREDLELFVGGELKLPLQRRKARGKLEQAVAKLAKLRFEQRFQKDRITNEILDARSAIETATRQLADARVFVESQRELVRLEQRAFDLGRSDLLRVQLREAQLANAQMTEIDARLGLLVAHADYRAALGFADDRER